MSKLSEQLMEALKFTESFPEEPKQYTRVRLISWLNHSKHVLDMLSQLLTEHEKLERESEAGKVFVEKMQRLSDSGDCGRWLVQDLLEYRTACEK